VLFSFFIDSLEHRAQVRAGLAVNTEWISRYFAKILPWMTGQQNSVISVVPGITFNNSEENGFYQLQTINYTLNKNAQKELKKSPILKSKQGDLLVGAFTTCHGNLNTAVLLWKHPTLTAATQLVNDQLNGISIALKLLYKRHERIIFIFLDEECWKNVATAYSKVLMPHKVSPLQ